MRHVLVATFSIAVLTACGGADSSAGGESGGEAVTAGGGGSFTVSGLGTSDTTFLTLRGNSLTFVNESGKGQQTGTLLPSSPAGFQAFGNFSPDGFVAAGEQIHVATELLSKGSGKVVLFDPNVTSNFESTGHTSTQAELTRDHCLPQLRNLEPVDASHPGKITKLSATKYKWEMASPAGDFVYDVDVKASGLQCTFVSMPPVSCSAVVADAIAKAASDAGSSSGEPFVNKVGEGSYNGGIHDEESGEFRFEVTTNSSADHCKVTKVIDKTPK